MDVKVGVINPYALGEAVAGKNINWNTVANPQQTLSSILNLSEADIFDIRNPILNPNIQVDSAGNVTPLKETAATDRLATFLSQRIQRPATTAMPMMALRLPTNTEAKLNTSLFSAAIQLSGSSTPWTPAELSWVDKGDYFEDVSEFNDPIQGALGDCYYIAALSSVAWARPYVIVNMVRPSAWGDEEGPIHRVGFYANGAGAAQYVEVSEKTPVNKTTNAWVYARSLDTTEIWPAVMEKAYAKWRTSNTTDFPNYPAISGGDPVMACAQLMCGQRTYKSNASMTGDDLWQFVRGHSLSMRTVNPMVAWTYGSQPAGTDYAAARVVANHAYSILGWDYVNGIKYIVLRNPWGTHHATLDTRSGAWNPTQISYTASVPLNTNGVFSMKADTFKKYFAGAGVAV